MSNPADKIEESELLQEEKALLDWFKTVKFKKTLLGGLQEADVWKQLNDLNELYKAALSAERARYDALLLERTHAFDRILSKDWKDQQTREG